MNAALLTASVGDLPCVCVISFFNFSGRMEAASGLPMDGPQLGEQLVKML